MTRSAAILIVLIIASSLVPAVHAQNGSAPDSCSTKSGATTWWINQQSRVEDHEIGTIQEFWDAILPQLQVGDISRPADHCRFLDLVLRVGSENPENDTRLVEQAASVAEKLPPEHTTLAQPVLFDIGDSVGSALEQKARGTNVTTERISILQQARTVYSETGLEGAAARTNLWMNAENQTWKNDLARTNRHLQEAQGLVDHADASFLSAFVLGRGPSLQETLETDRAIMASHGAADRVEEIEAMGTRLESARTIALQQAVFTTLLLVAAASGLYVLVRGPLSLYERDADEVEAMLEGVPR